MSPPGWKVGSRDPPEHPRSIPGTGAVQGWHWGRSPGTPRLCCAVSKWLLGLGAGWDRGCLAPPAQGCPPPRLPVTLVFS